MKILFTHSYFYRFDPKQWKDKKPYPPLGTIQAAAVLREAGHSVSLFDVALKHGPEEILQIIEKERPELLVIYDDGFNYLTKMCLTNMREAAYKMATWAKENGIKVAICSSDSTDHFKDYLANGATVVVTGEGEATLTEFVEKKLDPTSVSGLVYATDNGPVRNAPRPVMNDLDALPLPAWDLVDVPSYEQIWRKAHGYFSLNIATTRGCPFKCNWCAKPIYGNRYHSRSPEHVADEIALLLEQYKPDHFWMCDDIFGLKPGWAQEFEKVIKERQLQFVYMIQSRVDLLLKEDTIDALIGSGMEEVWVGAESGSQRILDAMDKGTMVEQIRESTAILKKKGVRVGFFLQFGYLGETGHDIIKTLEMLDELMPDDIGVSVSYPLPGTGFYEKVKSELDQKSNWEDSDELALMFRNTYLPEFYKRLHRYIHKRYRKKQGMDNLKAILRSPGQMDQAKIRSVLGILYYIPTSIIERARLRRTEKEMI